MLFLPFVHPECPSREKSVLCLSNMLANDIKRNVILTQMEYCCRGNPTYTESMISKEVNIDNHKSALLLLFIP